MWGVLRRIQGEEYEASPPTKSNIQQNLNHIAMFECRENAKPQHPQMLPEPYGAGLYPKLVSTLNSPDLVLRRKAVSSMLHYFKLKQEHVAAIIDNKSGIPALVKTLSDEDVEVRIKSAIALRYIAEQAKGQQEILDRKLEEKLKDAVYDAKPQVVIEALKILAALDSHWNDRAGTKALIAVNCIPLYIQQARDGVPAVQVEALKALHKVYNVKDAYVEVLEKGGMEVLSVLLNSLDFSVVREAAENIAELCFFQAGKRAAVQTNATTNRFIELMSHTNVTVRTSVSAALMATTIEIAGKEQCLACNGVDTIMDCMENESDPNVLANCTKIVCNMSEHPEARVKLHAVVGRLREITEQKGVEERLVSSCSRAIEMITWKP